MPPNDGTHAGGMSQAKAVFLIIYKSDNSDSVTGAAVFFPIYNMDRQCK